MTRRTPPSAARPTPGYLRGRRVADLMTHDHLSFVRSSNAAERAGEAATALEYHQGIPVFQRSAHRVVLTQLADLAEEMTPWLWARWAAYQCTRAEDSGTACAERSRAALDYTLQMFHAESLEATYLAGRDPMPEIAQTVGEDWVYHQLCTYSFGGLASFLDTLATGRLAREGSLARSWVDSCVSGYRLEGTSPGRLTVRGLAEDRAVELLDLGAGTHADAGGWLIGRLVPSGTTPSLMFDTRPLPVDQQAAVQASTGDRRAAWVTALTTAFADGRLDRALTMSEDRELATDVASLALLEQGTAPGALEVARDRLGRGHDEIGRAAFRILRAAADGSRSGDDEAPYVAAAVTHPGGWAEARRRLVLPEHRARLAHWSRWVTEPARGRLLRLADPSDPAG